MCSLSYVGLNKWYDQGDLRFHPDNIITNGWNPNLIYIIARHDHPDGKWASGDIAWRTGPDYSYDNPEYKLGQIIAPYDARMIPSGLPGAGNILALHCGRWGGFGSLIAGLPGYFPNKYRDYSQIISSTKVYIHIILCCLKGAFLEIQLLI